MSRKFRLIWCLVVVVPTLRDNVLADSCAQFPTANPSRQSQLLVRAEAYRAAACYDSALDLLSRAVEEAHTSLETSNTSLANIYNALGLCHLDKGDFSSGEHFLQKALATYEEAEQPDSLCLVDILNNLGRLSYELGRFKPGRQYIMRAINAVESSGGALQCKLLACYNNLVAIYLAESRLAIADSISACAVALCQVESPLELTDVAACWHNAGNLKRSLALYDEAEIYLNRALAVYEGIYSQLHPKIGEVLQDQANLLRNVAQYREADSLLNEAARILTLSVGDQHPLIAQVYNDLASLYFKLGRYAEIKPLTDKAIRIIENKLGHRHPALAYSLTCLASLYYAEGKYLAADSLFEIVLQIKTQTFGEVHSSIASTLNNLGTLNTVLGNYEKAEYYEKRGLDVRRHVLGPGHPHVAKSSIGVALVMTRQGKYAEARPYVEEALVIREGAYGGHHPDVAQCHDYLGVIHHALQEYEEAILRKKQALTVYRETLGESHSNVARNANAVARYLVASGNYREGLRYYGEFLDHRRRFAEYVLSFSSEEQKLRWLGQFPLIDNGILTLALQHESPETKRIAMEMILKGKASVIDALMAERETAFCTEDTATRLLFEERGAIRTKIANIVLAEMRRRPAEKDRDSLPILLRQNDSLEATLGRRCYEFGTHIAANRFTVTQVAEALPQGTALWEYVKYVPHEFSMPRQRAENSDSGRYLCFALSRANKITLVDLGNARTVDSLVDLTRALITDVGAKVYLPIASELENQLSKVAGRLYELLVAPLVAQEIWPTNVLISSDGRLRLLPFDILVRPDGSYLIESYRICYLSSGRDVLRFANEKDLRHGAIVIADPDFDAVSLDRPAARADDAFAGLPELGPDTAWRGGQESGDCPGNDFTPLRFSRDEMSAVRDALELTGNIDITAFCGAEAGEHVLKTISTPPKILHLATHGFFCEDRGGQDSNQPTNPLVRSGLALAGANQVDVDGWFGEDGILTAYEASGLNLVGTELATLSACETGLGEDITGEGILGLRRALLHAGSQTVLSALWKTPDKETSELMANYYRCWLEGKSKADALRESALTVLRESRQLKGHGHPFFWGGYVLLGNPD